jgi:hypothetical protein
LLLRQEGQNIVVERRTLADAAAAITLKGPDGVEQTIVTTQSSPGIFTATRANAAPGIYTATDGTLTTVAAIGNSDDKEAGDVRATPDILAPALAATRSGAFWLEDGMPRLSKAQAGSLMAGGNWAAIRDNQQFKVTAVKDVALFSTLASLAALLLLIAGMWYREGR